MLGKRKGVRKGREWGNELGSMTVTEKIIIVEPCLLIRKGNVMTDIKKKIMNELYMGMEMENTIY